MYRKLSSITIAGKITVATGIFTVLTIILFSTVGVVSSTADAKNASSTVKVLNTPPQFKGDAYEIVPSATATPSLFGTNIAFAVPANDSSDNGMYMLVCKTGGAPTASSSTAPSCAGGASNLIAVSDAPLVGAYPGISTLYATTSVPINDVANETQDWYVFLCDNDNRTPRCSVSNTGTPAADNASPYHINHPHSFTGLVQDGPTNPGGTMTFTSTVSETIHVDTNGPADTARLFLCKQQDFTGTDCGAGGVWASSTVSVASNPTAAITFTIPYQDGAYSGYGYVLDSHAAPATGASQGAVVGFAVSNVAPTVTASSITFTPGTLVVTNPVGLTGGYGMSFSTSDDNSCIATTSAPEMQSVRVQIGRNSLFGTTCKDGDPFNSNNCYNNSVASSTWDLICIQNLGSCSGISDPSVTWDCTFPLWSNADPTDAGTPWTGDNWNARVAAVDNELLSGTSTIDNPVRYAVVQSYPYIDLGSDTIDFGEFEPGAAPPDLGTGAAGSVLGVQSKGNTAFDLNMQTSDMCPNYSNGCTGSEENNTIFGNRQHYASTTYPYWSPLAATGTTSTLSSLEINVKKPIATGTPSTRDIHWGILVPATITISGDYKGVNRIEFLNETDYSSW